MGRTDTVPARATSAPAAFTVTSITGRSRDPSARPFNATFPSFLGGTGESIPASLNSRDGSLARTSKRTASISGTPDSPLRVPLMVAEAPASLATLSRRTCRASPVRTPSNTTSLMEVPR